MALEQEYATYKKLLPDLLDREGKFVLIFHDALVGVFDTQDESLREGYERFGFHTPFFTKQIKANEQPIVFGRGVRSCALIVNRSVTDPTD